MRAKSWGERTYLMSANGFGRSINPLKLWATWVYGYCALFWGALGLIRVPKVPETYERLRNQALWGA